MRQNRQTGFSLLELLVAMMIIAVIATLGFKQYNKYSTQAKYLKAQDTLRIVGEGLDQYFIQHGVYPNLTTYESMIDASSPLVKENLVPPNVPTKDPWQNPFEATASKGNYVLKCQGDPGLNPAFPPFSRQPGRMSDDQNSQTPGAAGATPGATPGAAPAPAKGATP
ncbi:MAG: type II secretion system protein [Holophaga sp.]|nr:type II secretion system protein [Holophaga sp.]